MRDIKSRRVLITGSRTWTDEKALADALGPHFAPGAVLVSGACEEGADAIAERIWARLGGQIERHPADWYPDGKFDRLAGFKRNTRMAKSGITVCVAAVERCAKPTCKKSEPHGTHGAEHCVGEAEAAGVAVDRHGFSSNRQLQKPSRECKQADGTRAQADRWHYEAGHALKAGDCHCAMSLVLAAEFIDPDRRELWARRGDQILVKANRMPLEVQTQTRLIAAGIAAEDTESVTEWNRLLGAAAAQKEAAE